MLATLTLMSALSLPAADAGELQLTNARVTYGRLGPTRKDTKFLPGDVYFVTFDIEGLQFNKEGNAQMREVHTGIASRTDVEILDGVAEGDTVVDGPYRTLARELQDGQKVKPAKPSSGSDKPGPQGGRS